MKKITFRDWLKNEIAEFYRIWIKPLTRSDIECGVGLCLLVLILPLIIICGHPSMTFVMLLLLDFAVASVLMLHGLYLDDIRKKEKANLEN